MVKPLVMLIPPLGHDSTFYVPLQKVLGEDVQLVLCDYPYQADLSAVPAGELLETLAKVFIDQLGAARQERAGQGKTLIGGVSLGATLSIRMNHLLAEKPDALLLFAPGGLKVSSARKNMIRSFKDRNESSGFIRQSLAIEADRFEDASFARQFCRVSEQVIAYWHHYAHELWDVAADSVQSRNFLGMINAALDVDYEDHLRNESQTYHIFWSEKDKVFSPRMLRKFQLTATRARFHLLPDIGHYAPLESPGIAAQLIREACGVSS